MSQTSLGYNPLDRANLEKSIATAILDRPVVPIPCSVRDRMVGSGVYALYYTGPFGLYEPLARRNREVPFSYPIYVGKAAPKGARTGAEPEEGDKYKLYLRLQQHARSIRKTDLNVADFHCRYLVVEDIWIPLGESLLIRQFQPLWNSLLFGGFGNNDTGGNRAAQDLSAWDLLHPGRRAKPLSAEDEARRQTAADAVAQYMLALRTTDPPSEVLPPRA